MKIMSIEVSERQAAEIEAALAEGGYASLSELVEAALDAFLAQAPDPAELEADIDAFEARRAAGERAVPLDAAFEALLADLRR